MGGGARIADPGLLRGSDAGSGGVARHLRAARGGGPPGRVAPARLARHAGLRILPRTEHAAGHSADLCRGDPAGDQVGIGRRGCRPRREKRRDRARASAALPRDHPAFPAYVARPDVARRDRGPAAAGRGGRRGSSSRPRGSISSGSTVRPVPADIHVRADEAELQHTLINLLLNAVQACTPGGRVAVAADGGRDRCASASPTTGAASRRKIRSDFRAILQSERRHGTGLVPVAQFRPPVGRGHPRRRAASAGVRHSKSCCRRSRRGGGDVPMTPQSLLLVDDDSAFRR